MLICSMQFDAMMPGCQQFLSIYWSIDTIYQYDRHHRINDA